MNRRGFLKAAAGVVLSAGGLAALGGALIPPGDLQAWWQNFNQFWRIEEDSNIEHFSYNEAAQLALRFHNAYDRLPPYRPIVNKDTITWWAMVIIPFFPIEGAVDESVLPSILDLYFFSKDAEAHDHVLGRSDCSSYAILNVRLGDPFDSWADTSVKFLFTEAHELAHTIQGDQICEIFTNDPLLEEKRRRIEWTAQIVAFENCSALANEKNVYALYAITDELQGIGMSVLRAAAIRENRLPEYEALRRQVYPGALSEANYQRGKRYWADKQAELLSQITRYDESVIVSFDAAQRSDKIVRGLALQPVFNQVPGGGGVVSAPRELLVDDTLYVLEHLEDMVEDARQKIEKGEVVLKFQQ